MKTWSAKDYSVHGQCQNTMAKSEKFFDGKGLVVQIRTTRIDRPHGKSYSYISGAAIKVGDDVVEVQNDGSAIINGVNDLLDDDGDVDTPVAAAATRTFDGFRLSKSIKGKHDNIYVYDLSYDNGAAIQIRANLKTGIVNVDLSGSYPEDMMGLLGSQHHSKLLARDGETDLTGMYNTFFNEWQVRDDEPQLFINEDYVPLYPQPCLYKEVKKSNVRRRLSDVEPVSIEAAEEACAGALPDKKQYCIDDVTATGDLELAEDRFYTGIMV